MPERDFEACWREACAVVDEPALRDFFDPGRYETARNEMPLLYRHGTRQVSGVMDRIVVLEERVILIDYKTHRHATRANISALAERYREQLQLYGTGLQSLWPGRDIRLLLLFTACRELVPVDTR